VAAFGCVPPPGSVFEGVRVLPAGHYLVAAGGNLQEAAYWDIPYPAAGEYLPGREGVLAARLRELLLAACTRRLRADVPVGLYLSGGIDSATVGALVRHVPGVRERVFSIGFPEPGFDESARVRSLARYLGLEANILTYTQGSLAAELPRLVYHAETPLVSTESVPLMALSGLASRQVKVVLTGEGSDEALGGYEYFRWEVCKDRFGRPLAGRLLLSFLQRWFRRVFGERNPFFPGQEDLRWAEEVFGFYPAGMMQFFYWRRIRELIYSAPMLARLEGHSDGELLPPLPPALLGWDQLNRSLYVSSRVFLQGHLLAAHGDRALMASSVEGRYPFLDRSVQEFLAGVPPWLKVRPGGRFCTEKYLLRRAMEADLPAGVVWRRKKMFLAPFGTPFVGTEVPEYAAELLSPARLREFGYFDPDKVQALVQALTDLKGDLARDRGESVRVGRRAFERTLLGMALTFVLSAQLLAEQLRAGAFGTQRQKARAATSGSW
jgi:asparagine synthase (glutamine-hydrolysing)